MELTPSQISGATFRTVRKGYDPEEVDAFLRLAADALEAAQQQATAMEARARAAVARLQEVSAAAASTAPPIEAPPVAEQEPEPLVERVQRLDHRRPDQHDELYEPHLRPDEAETISRTLLLAQHTADTTVADAEAEAERIRLDAQTEAEATIDSTREMSARLLEEARSEARKASEEERKAAENEVQSLKARREFLVGDVDHLERFLEDQRKRLRGAARQIEALVERVPSGLGPFHPPILSASDDEPGDDTGELILPPEAQGPFATVDELAEAIEQGETQPIPRAELFDTIDDDSEELNDSADDLPMRGETGMVD